MIDLTEIQKLKTEIKDLDLKINEIEKEKSKKKDEVIAKVLENDNVLNENEWFLNHDTSINSTSKKHPTLCDLLQTDYHCYYDLKDFMLNFDDWDISIQFTKKEFLETFIKTHKIRLDSSSVEAQIERLKKSIESDSKLLQKCEEQLTEIKRNNEK